MLVPGSRRQAIQTKAAQVSFAHELSRRCFGVGNFIWELSLRTFRLISHTRDLSLKNHCLGPFAWKLRSCAFALNLVRCISGLDLLTCALTLGILAWGLSAAGGGEIGLAAGWVTALQKLNQNTLGKPS